MNKHYSKQYKHYSKLLDIKVIMTDVDYNLGIKNRVSGFTIVKERSFKTLVITSKSRNLYYIIILLVIIGNLLQNRLNITVQYYHTKWISMLHNIIFFINV